MNQVSEPEALVKPDYSSVFAASLTYAALGWRVLPCRARDKRPLLNDWPHQATTDLATITVWALDFPRANVGVATGEGSGIWVLDIDGPEGLESLRALEAQYGPLPDTAKQKTGGGGLQLFWRWPRGLVIKNSASKVAPHIDVRGDGGYVVVPPSVHPKGPRYEWLEEPTTTPPADAPQWLLELVAAPASPPSPPSAPQHNGNISATNGNSPAKNGNSAPIPEGKRNATLASLAGSMRRKGATAEAIEQALLAENAARCVPPLDVEEVKRIADSISRYPAAESGEAWHDTDTGNAEALAFYFGNMLRYAAPAGMARGRWLVWAGHRWRGADVGEVEECAKQTARRRLEAATALEDSDKRKRAVTWALSSESAPRRAAMLELARSETPIAARQGDFDQDPWLVGAANGVIDLKNGELRPGAREDMISRAVGCAYDPTARAPRWEQFLLEVFDGDAALVAWIKRAAGYSLTGDTREQCLFLLHGGGANGKSLLLATLRAVWGDYAAATPFSTFEQTNATATNDLASLAGARLVTASETAEARNLNEARVKAITGGDAITCRFLYSEFFTYQPTFKIWLAMNELPRIQGTDNGIWRRVRLIPFRVSFTGKKADPELANKLLAEKQGILRWAVEGAMEWRAVGLGAPAAVAEATEAYRRESDVVGRFLEAATVQEAGARVRAADLYRAYVAWCEAQGERPASGTTFGRRMTARGIARQKGRDVIYYEGIKMA